MGKYNTRSQSAEIQASILDIFQELEPRLTVRQIYYALTVRGAVPKTEQGYRQTIYQLGKMRQRGIIPYGWIADHTRWQIKPRTHNSLQAALDDWQQGYRKDLWANQQDYVEIWVEKDALAGVISPITAKFGVPLYVARGYSSMTQLYDAAKSIQAVGKPAFIYHFGDFDPSGVDAANKIREGLLEHGANIHFERVAITEAQITLLDLPTRETKPSDPRSKQWGDMPSVELDALPAPVLRDLVKETIRKHIDPLAFAMTRLIEKKERETLAVISENLVLGQNSADEWGGK